MRLPFVLDKPDVIALLRGFSRLLFPVAISLPVDGFALAIAIQNPGVQIFLDPRFDLLGRQIQL